MRTPGPWNFYIDDYNVNHLDSEHKTSGYATLSFGDEQYYPWCGGTNEDWQLISATPDLYEACKKVLNSYVMDIEEHDCEEWKEEVTKLRSFLEAAVSKAEATPKKLAREKA